VVNWLNGETERQKTEDERQVRSPLRPKRWGYAGQAGQVCELGGKEDVDNIFRPLVFGYGLAYAKTSMDFLDFMQ
jgi:hypothetical protein